MTKSETSTTASPAQLELPFPEPYRVPRQPARRPTDLVTPREAAAATGLPLKTLHEVVGRRWIRAFDPDGERIEPAGTRGYRVSRYEVERYARLQREEEQRHDRPGVVRELGFHGVPEYERTRHVHRLHPYQGKFIPQVVEWFLERYFQPGDLVLDPFMGSGTTLVQAAEMGIASAGVDISLFNCTIAEVKVARYDLEAVGREVETFLERVIETLEGAGSGPVEADGGPKRARARRKRAKGKGSEGYLSTWFAPPVQREIQVAREALEGSDHPDLLRVILSRAARSARLVPHFDLVSASKPVDGPYWCHKHRKICEPTTSLLPFLRRYARDTLRRLEAFAAVRKEVDACVIHGDSRAVDLRERLARPVSGVFSSPPYVGQIDYHDSHQYAYEIFGIPDHAEQEIGPKRGGKSRKAREDYVEGIAAVLRNVRPALVPGAPVLLVANDRFDLYPRIGEEAGLRLERRFERAVSKRAERDRTPYYETIFLFRPPE